MNTTATQQLATVTDIIEETEQDSVLTEEYRKLDEKCDLVIAKIKSRKNKRNNGKK
jgi:hypothetical protein